MTSESSNEYGVEFRAWQGQEKEHFKCVWTGGGLHEKTGKYWMKQSWWGLWPYWIVVVIQLLSHVQLFVTAWTAACQASLSFTISWSLLKLMSIESMIPSNHPTIQPSHPVTHFSCPQPFPASGSFWMSWLFTSGGQTIGASASASVLPMNNQVDFL